MDRCNKIITNPKYREYLQENQAEEENRLFCNHHFDHLLAVARLTYLLLLEEGNACISREIVYASGLLHDIGKHREYRDNLDHAVESAALADPILEEAGFPLPERHLIQRAISRHREKEGSFAQHSVLDRALIKADLYSRLCFFCTQAHNCKKIDIQPHRGRLEY